MTLRVTVEIVPKGIEEDKHVIGILDVSNLRDIEALGFGHVLCEYEYKFYDEDGYDDPPYDKGCQVFHDRKDGFWSLIRKVLNEKCKD